MKGKCGGGDRLRRGEDLRLITLDQIMELQGDMGIL
jgi:hypothetical protein